MLFNDILSFLFVNLYLIYNYCESGPVSYLCLLKYDFFHEVFIIYIEVLSFAIGKWCRFFAVKYKKIYGNSSIQHIFF